MLTKAIIEFVQDHLNDDPARLLLAAHRYPGVPVQQAVAQIRALPWKLLGVHSSRLDMNTRDLALDESLGLNCAWYADILLTLTADVPAPATVQPQQLT